MFKINTRETIELERKLERIKSTAIPYAVRNTLTSLAFETRAKSIETIERKMITRNRWTRNSIRVNRATGTQVRRMESRAGSTEQYMEDQEFGATKRRKCGGLAIATSVASGEGENARPRRRLPRKPNKLSSIRLRNQRVKAKTRGQRNFIAVKQAVASGNKFLYMDLGRRKGIFKIKGGKRNPQIQMLHDTSRKSVRIPKAPWLQPSTQEAVSKRDEFYRKSLAYQLKNVRP